MKWHRAMALLWIAAVIVTSVQAATAHNNNFEIFRTAWHNLADGRDLYTANPSHFDFYKYSPTFALLFAPFAVLPFWLGVLLWNGANAGALYWGLGRVLEEREALLARAIVFLDLVGSMQNAQSNAVSAGLMIIAFAELQKKHEWRGAIAVTLGTVIKIFPLAAAVFAVFRPFRARRFVIAGLTAGAVAVALPLLVVTPAELGMQYRSWGAIQSLDALTRGFSVMGHVHLWLRADWPNWPIQALGAAVLLAPLVRIGFWGIRDFRLRFLASVLMFVVLFNHKAESPTFVIAMAGVAIWFVAAARGRWGWGLLLLVAVGTVLSSSEAMPAFLQERFFEPYRLKTLPVLAVWIVTQVELWSRRTPASPPIPGSAPGKPET